MGTGSFRGGPSATTAAQCPALPLLDALCQKTPCLNGNRFFPRRPVCNNCCPMPSVTTFGCTMPENTLPEWEQVLSAAARLQQLLPDAQRYHFWMHYARKHLA